MRTATLHGELMEGTWEIRDLTAAGNLGTTVYGWVSSYIDGGVRKEIWWLKANQRINQNFVMYDYKTTSEGSTCPKSWTSRTINYGGTLYGFANSEGSSNPETC